MVYKEARYNRCDGKKGGTESHQREEVDGGASEGSEPDLPNSHKGGAT